MTLQQGGQGEKEKERLHVQVYVGKREMIGAWEMHILNI